MKIEIPKEKLVQTLELVSKTSTKHVTLPILQCVLLEVKNGLITFKATNLEIGIEVVVEGKIEEEGMVAVPANTLLQSIQYFNNTNITLTVEDNVLTLESGKSRTDINIVPAEDFPPIPKITSNGIAIQKDLFALGIKTVAFSASPASIKPELGCIYIQQKKEHSLTFVSTDSFRLMEKTVAQNNLVLDSGLLIPQKNAQELARVCEVMKSDPELLVNDNQCALAFPDGVYITSRLVVGSFPDYEQIIPKEFTLKAKVLKSDLQQSLRKTSIFLNKFMQVTLYVAGSDLTVSSQNGDVGSTTDSVSIQSEGDELTLNFNQQYLHEPLQHISDDTLELNFAGIGRALVMKGAHDHTLRYLVMPMNR